MKKSKIVLTVFVMCVLLALTFTACNPTDNPTPTPEITYTYEVKNPTKTTFYVGEKLDLNGFGIIKNGSDGSGISLVLNSDYTIDSSAFDNTKTGEYTISYSPIGGASFGGSFKVQVVALQEFSGANAQSASEVYFEGIQLYAQVTKPANPSNITVSYRFKDATDEGAEFGEWSATVPTLTSVGKISIEIKFSADNYADLVKSATIEVLKGTINAAFSSNTSFDYNSNAHKLTLNAVLPDDAVVRYSTSENGEYDLKEMPEYTDAGEYYVGVKITADNYHDFTASAVLTINPLDGLTGIAAADILNIADGTKYTLSITGTEQGDKLFYRTSEKDEWTQTVPVMTWSGRMTVYYKVQRGNTYAAGSAEIVLVPDAEIPNFQVVSSDLVAKWTGASHTLSFANAYDTDIFYSLDGESWRTQSYYFSEVTEGAVTIYYKAFKYNVGYMEGSAKITINKNDYHISEISKVPTFTVTYSEGMTLADLDMSFSSHWRFSDDSQKLDFIGTRYYQGIYNADSAHYNDYTDNYSSSKIKVEVKSIQSPDTVKAASFEGAYDGQPHGITLSGVPEGYTVEFATKSDGNYSTDIITATESTYTSGGITVYYKISKDFYTTITGWAYIVINRAVYTDISYNETNTLAVDFADNLKLEDIELKENFRWDNILLSLSAGTNAYTVIYNADYKNYEDFTFDITLTVNKINITDVICENIEITFGESRNYHIVKRNGDSLLLSSADSPYDWQDAGTVLNKSYDAGVYTIFFKVTRQNYNDFISSYTLTINPKQAVLEVSNSSVYYNGQNHAITIAAKELNGGYINAAYYTVYYFDNGTAQFTETAPQLIYPDDYTVTIKVESQNFSFDTDTAIVSFTIRKASYYEYHISYDVPDIYGDLLELVNGVERNYYNYQPDLTSMKAALAAEGLNEGDYTLQYSLNYDSDSPQSAVWTDSIILANVCSEKYIYFKLVTPYFEDDISFFEVTIDNYNNFPDLVGTFLSPSGDAVTFKPSDDASKATLTFSGTEFVQSTNLFIIRTSSADAATIYLFATNDDYKSAIADKDYASHALYALDYQLIDDAATLTVGGVVYTLS